MEKKKEKKSTDGHWNSTKMRKDKKRKVALEEINEVVHKGAKKSVDQREIAEMTIIKKKKGLGKASKVVSESVDAGRERAHPSNWKGSKAAASPERDGEEGADNAAPVRDDGKYTNGGAEMLGGDLSSPESRRTAEEEENKKEKKKDKKKKKKKKKKEILRQDVKVDGNAVPAIAEDGTTGRQDREKQDMVEEPAAEVASRLQVAARVRGSSSKQRESCKKDLLSAVPRSAGTTVSWRDDSSREGLKFGKFSPEDDAAIRAAFNEYIRSKGWGEEEGVSRLLRNTSSRGARRGAWMEIAQCLPERSVMRVWNRAARILHEGNYLGKWTPEEEESLRRLHMEHGPKWNVIGAKLGRIPDALKDKWRQIKDADKVRKGRWSLEERQKLYFGVLECGWPETPRPAIGGQQVRDNINWSKVVEKMEGARHHNQCVSEWYHSLAPGMVAAGEWDIRDDRRLLQALVGGAADSEADIDWDSLLDNRSATVCKKRWRQMTKYLKAGWWQFDEQLRMAVERFAPDLAAEAGEGEPPRGHADAPP